MCINQMTKMGTEDLSFRFPLGIYMLLATTIVNGAQNTSSVITKSAHLAGEKDLYFVSSSFIIF